MVKIQKKNMHGLNRVTTLWPRSPLFKNLFFVGNIQCIQYCAGIHIMIAFMPIEETTGHEVYCVFLVLLYFRDSISRTGAKLTESPILSICKRWFLAKTSRNIFLIYHRKNLLILMVFPSGGVFEHLTSHCFH